MKQLQQQQKQRKKREKKANETKNKKEQDTIYIEQFTGCLFQNNVQQIYHDCSNLNVL